VSARLGGRKPASRRSWFREPRAEEALHTECWLERDAGQAAMHCRTDTSAAAISSPSGNRIRIARSQKIKNRAASAAHRAMQRLRQSYGAGDNRSHWGRYLAEARENLKCPWSSVRVWSEARVEVMISAPSPWRRRCRRPGRRWRTLAKPKNERRRRLILVVVIEPRRRPPMRVTVIASGSATPVPTAEKHVVILCHGFRPTHAYRANLWVIDNVFCGPCIEIKNSS